MYLENPCQKKKLVSILDNMYNSSNNDDLTTSEICNFTSQLYKNWFVLLSSVCTFKTELLLIGKKTTMSKSVTHSETFISS